MNRPFRLLQSDTFLCTSNLEENDVDHGLGQLPFDKETLDTMVGTYRLKPGCIEFGAITYAIDDGTYITFKEACIETVWPNLEEQRPQPTLKYNYGKKESPLEL